MLQRPPDFLSDERLMVRCPARSMGTNGLQIEISGNAGRRPANHAITERRGVYRASRRGLQGFCAGASLDPPLPACELRQQPHMRPYAVVETHLLEFLVRAVHLIVVQSKAHQ